MPITIDPNKQYCINGDDLSPLVNIQERLNADTPIKGETQHQLWLGVTAILDHMEEDEHEALFNLIHAADMRAITMWREGHPERQLVQPDRARMVLWLLERMDRMHEFIHQATGGRSALCQFCGEKGSSNA